MESRANFFLRIMVLYIYKQSRMQEFSTHTQGCGCGQCRQVLIVVSCLHHAFSYLNSGGFKDAPSEHMYADKVPPKDMRSYPPFFQFFFLHEKGVEYLALDILVCMQLASILLSTSFQIHILLCFSHLFSNQFLLVQWVTFFCVSHSSVYFSSFFQLVSSCIVGVQRSSLHLVPGVARYLFFLVLSILMLLFFALFFSLSLSIYIF